MDVKLYVGNLSLATTEADLRKLFAQAGTVTSVEVVKERQLGQPKGFAFVTMGSAADAQTAISMLNAYSIAGRELIVKRVKTREAPTGNSARLSAFAPTRRAAPARSPKTTANGYQSRLSAFGAGNGQSGSRRRGTGKRS